MKNITSPIACFVLFFQNQHIANSLHLSSWARHRASFSIEGKVQQGKGRIKNLLCGAPACSQGCCSLQRTLAGSTPAPAPSPCDEHPSTGHGAEPALPAPGPHASSGSAIQILPLMRGPLTFSVSDIISPWVVLMVVLQS